MLHLLAELQSSDRTSLRDALTAYVHALSTPTPPGDITLVGRVENEVRAAPGMHISFDSTGRATLSAAGRTFQGGHFETPRLGELRRRAAAARLAAGDPGARLRCFVLDGISPATDIRALQATAPPDSLFQIASQFNCLEAPAAFVADIPSYVYDPTQGPRASLSAFPGTMVRHYAAPANDGARFVQTTDGLQINLLEELCADGVAQVRSGYLMTDNIVRPAEFARALEERFDHLHSGVHDGIEVVFGYNWNGPVSGAPHHTIAQVLCSTVAAGGYSRLAGTDAATETIVQQLQRAAYFGTLLAAAALGKAYAVLTLVGGGVFGNPIPLIWESILWAMDAVAPLVHRDLCVVVNGYNLGRHIPAHVLRAAAAARGGALVVFKGATVTVPEP